MSPTACEVSSHRRRSTIGGTALGALLLVVPGCAAANKARPQFAAEPAAPAAPAVMASQEHAEDVAGQPPRPVQTMRLASWPNVAVENPVVDPGLEDNQSRTEAPPEKIVVEAVATPVNESDDLQTLIATALAIHPRIKAARQKVAAINNRFPQVTSLPDPMFSNTFWPIHDQALQTAGGRAGNQMSLSQKVPWPGKLAAQGNVVRRELQVAQAEVAQAERDITEAVRLAYYQLWLSEELIRIVEDNKELVADLITVSEARYRAGESQRDILRAGLEDDKLDDQLIALRRQREQARADLGTLVRRPIDWMSVAVVELDVGQFEPQLETLIAAAEECNPELQGLAAEIARDREKENVACLQQYPDLQFGIGWALINDDNNVISPVANGHDNVNLTVGVTLPIWRDKINAGIREAAHSRSSTIERHQAQRDRLRGQLRREVAAAHASIEQLELFSDRLVPRTLRILRIATADYQGGKTDFFNLVEIYRELLTYQVQVARTKATLASTLAQIERTVGCAVDDTPR